MVLVHSITILLVLNIEKIYGLFLVNPNVQRIQKVGKADFDQSKHYYHTHKTNGNPYETPILVKGVLSQEECESVCTSIMQELGANVIDLQRRTNMFDENNKKETQIDIFHLELGQAFGYMMESHHDDAFFCFCEGLLDESDKLKDVRKKLQDAKEQLFLQHSSRSDNEEEEDLFEYFPEGVKPKDCLVVAGEGATSTFHRDPFCWTGTSLCVEGTKIWRFIAPPGHNEDFKEEDLTSGVKFVDDAVKSYRLPSVAWDDQYISCGWQSDLSLYSQRSDDLPSAEELSMMEEENPQIKMDYLDDVASSLHMLEPSSDFPSQLGCDGNFQTKIWSVVQHPGDLLIIPAYWWHQTYAVEPSIAIASQRGGSGRDRKRILSHVLETMEVDDGDTLPPLFKAVLNDSFDGSQEDVAGALFRLLSKFSLM